MNRLPVNRLLSCLFKRSLLRRRLLQNGLLIKGLRGNCLLCVCLALGVALSACEDEAQNVYSRYRASLSVNNVSTVTPLNAALNGFGEFCTIRQTPASYVYQTLHQTQTVNKTDADAYAVWRSIGGFIVGRGSLPEMGASTQPILCYDLACPNCYRDSYVARPLALQPFGYALCERCHRRYDLNNFGFLASDTTGSKLERYRVLYAGSVLSVQN